MLHRHRPRFCAACGKFGATREHNDRGVRQFYCSLDCEPARAIRQRRSWTSQARPSQSFSSTLSTPSPSKSTDWDGPNVDKTSDNSARSNSEVSGFLV
ncbi:hypothetical protein Ae201684P_009473 [Aphanomyces euteiches]|uniref:Uncharacterized protein n=1 Tax=Aphanomyces euteiches TaxID=100861 RepID=A0A6G0WL64_9STRA|nr:hypothetical protein Ae201684_014116 [Aphanomyces euteiches]KAH9096238.1 hypothetical protein Ae201684P_009473 [Aphanomyces euteiches]